MDRTKLYLLVLSTACRLTLQCQTPTVSLELKGETAASSQSTPQKIVPDENGKPYFYLAAKAGGLQVYDLQNPAQPLLKKTFPIAQLSGLEVMNATQRGNFLYLALGNFFGNNGQAPGLAILDVSDPLNPALKDTWIWDTVDKGSASITISGDYAYLCAMTQGLFILNIADPGNIVFESNYVPDPNFPVPNPSAIHFPNARGVAVRNEIAYLCYDAGGLRIIDVSDKENPVETGHYANPVMGDKPQAFNNIVLNGDFAYVAVDYCGMEVLNISDASDISQVSWWNPWQCQSPSNIWVGSPGHTNQIAFDTASQLVFMSSAQSELSIVDVSNPSQPLLAGSYGTVDNQLGTWGVTLDGNRVFLTYITAVIPFVSTWAGIKILEWEQTSGTVETLLSETGKVFPNPFSDRFEVDFYPERKSELKIEIFNPNGMLVEKLAGSTVEPGKHVLAFESTLPSGVYFIHIEAGARSFYKKLVKI